MARGTGPIHYVSRRFPKLTETFVVEEVLGLEAAGERVIIDSLEAPVDEPRHPRLGELNARIRYVAEDPSSWQVFRAHAPLALRRPRTWVRLARRAKADGTWEEFRRAGLVARRTRAERARHVHTHFAYYCADVGGLAAALAGRPFTVTAHANDIWQEHNAPHLARRLSRATAVVTATEYNARHLRDVVPGVPVHVIPNSVVEAERLQAPAGGPLLCVGRLVPKKGVDTILRALAELAPDWPDLRLEVIGEGYLEGSLRELAAGVGVENRVVLRGPQPPEAVSDAYRRCSVVTLACRIADDGDRDGLPVVLLEALAHGLPVVTTDVVGIGEIVRDRQNGLLVPADDPSAFAAAVAELLSDRALAQKLGDAAHRFVREELAWDARVERLRTVLSRRPRGRPAPPPQPARTRRTD